ncbi:hypothetical protein [Pseudorhodoferax sp.]|uniref:hypothetical protein n=1 Tax=Pseudorhodoferax sp. TaxID=1993553 RepID=UPI0039E5E09D
MANIAGLVIAAALLVVSACGEEKNATDQLVMENGSPVMSVPVSINLGEMGPSFAKRYPGMVRVQHQPAGLDFYEIIWNSRNFGEVRINHAKHSFVVERVLALLSSQDLGEFEGDGLDSFSIRAAIGSSELISHDQARLVIYKILGRILDAGWRPTTPRSRPRLSGQARIDYVLNVSSSIGLDATHIPTYDEWIRIENRTSWGFYADGIFMDVTFTRAPTLTDPAKPGAYFLTYRIETAQEYFRSFAGPDNRIRWKEVLAQELAKVAAVRAQKEAELRVKGIRIDESYQDPPAPKFD